MGGRPAPAAGRRACRAGLTRLRHGRGYAYAPAQDEATHTARAMITMLRRGHDHEAVLARFLTELSPDDERLLEHLLHDTGEQ